jgi:cytochrome c biogenesis protein CcdA
VTPHSAATALLIAAAVIWILARQIRLAPVNPRLLVLAPLLLGYAGMDSLPASAWRNAADLALLALGAAVSVALGVWRGHTIAVWRDENGVWWRRGSKLTLALWGALFVARGALSVVALATGHPDASSSGALLLGLAVGFAAQNAVVGLRMTSPAPAPAR